MLYKRRIDMEMKRYVDESWICEMYDYDEKTTFGAVDFSNPEDIKPEDFEKLLLSRFNVITDLNIKLPKHSRLAGENFISRVILTKHSVDMFEGMMVKNFAESRVKTLFEQLKKFFSSVEDNKKFYVIIVNKYLYRPVVSLVEKYTEATKDVIPLFVSVNGCEEYVYNQHMLIKTGRLEKEVEGYSSVSFKFQPITLIKDTLCMMGENMTAKLTNTGMRISYDIYPKLENVDNNDDNEAGNGHGMVIFNFIPTVESFFSDVEMVESFNKLISSINNARKHDVPLYEKRFDLILESVKVINTENREKITHLNREHILDGVFNMLGYSSINSDRTVTVVDGNEATRSFGSTKPLFTFGAY